MKTRNTVCRRQPTHAMENKRPLEFTLLPTSSSLCAILVKCPKEFCEYRTSYPNKLMAHIHTHPPHNLPPTDTIKCCCNQHGTETNNNLKQ